MTESTNATGGSARNKWLLFIIVGILAFAADQATKVWARQSLPTAPAGCVVPDDIVARKCAGVPVPVIDGFWEWDLSMNTGVAFSMFAGKRWPLAVVGLLAVMGMIYMLHKARNDQKILHWALALVIGGAVGNLFERIYFGAVTDFVLWRYKQHRWPVFNVADVVLVVGVGLMMIDIIIEGRREKARNAQQSAV